MHCNQNFNFKTNMDNSQRLFSSEPVPTPVPVPNVRPPQGPVPPPAAAQVLPPRVTPGMAPNIGPAGASDQEKVRLTVVYL